MKIFISQPMNGIPKEKIREVRAEAAAKIKNEYPEARILESGVDCKPCVTNAELWMLAISLEIMADADMVYFCDGWENARGCRIERECAESYGVRILELGEWKENQLD